MYSKDLRQIRAALEVIKESKSLLVKLQVSITVSTASDLDRFLRSRRRALMVVFFIALAKMWLLAIGKAFITALSCAIFVLRWVGQWIISRSGL